MSLTSEIKKPRSPVGRFFRDTFPNTRTVLADCKSVLNARPILRLGDKPHKAAYGQVGMAIDYRIRYHFALTPPAKLVAMHGAAILDHWRDQDENVLPLKSPLSRSCMVGFFHALAGLTSEIAPHHRRPTDAEERSLARHCLVLAALEVVYRNLFAWPPPWLGDAPPDYAADLLARVCDDWVEDAAALGAAFAESYPSWHGSPEADLNPEFAGSLDIGGADADFIADGCLWDIKTTTGGPKSIYIFQIVGYALLDYDDEYTIERVGLLFPRQQSSVSWPIDELIARMSGDTGLELAALREQFRALLQANPTPAE